MSGLSKRGGVYMNTSVNSLRRRLSADGILQYYLLTCVYRFTVVYQPSSAARALRRAPPRRSGRSLAVYATCLAKGPIRATTFGAEEDMVGADSPSGLWAGPLAVVASVRRKL